MSNNFVQLKDGNNYLFPKSVPFGIDPDNKIADLAIPRSGTWTAPQDCVIFNEGTGANSSQGTLTIRNSAGSFVVRWGTPGNGGTFIKKGTILGQYDIYQGWLRAFGIKYI